MTSKRIVTFLQLVGVAALGAAAAQCSRSELTSSDGAQVALLASPLDPVGYCESSGLHVIVGTVGNDVLTGTDGPDCIVGLQGDDTIDGRAGNDIVFAGDGNDVVHGGNGDDQIFGDHGSDRLFGDGGNDALFGEDGSDQLEDCSGFNDFRAGAGDNVCVGDTLGTTNTFAECQTLLPCVASGTGGAAGVSGSSGASGGSFHSSGGTNARSLGGKSGSAGAIAGGTSGGSLGGFAGGATGGTSQGGNMGGSSGGDRGGSTGGSAGGATGGVTGGTSQGGTTGGSSGGVTGGSFQGGTAAGSTGGDRGGSTGSMGGDRGGSTGGSMSGATGGTSQGGSTGGAPTGCPATVQTIDGPMLCSTPYAVNECGEQCSQVTSTACLECEATINDGTADCNYASGVAESGPSAGTPRSELCVRTVECFRKTKCTDTGALRCYCGTTDLSCFLGGRNGPCADVMEAALETTDGALVGKRFTDPMYGGGLADVRAASDFDNCRGLCPSSITLCGDGTIESGETCDPPNGINCSSTCQFHACGNGVVEPTETCDPPNGADCSPSCQLPKCGNQVIELGESCDPPNLTNCSPSCQLHTCGNIIIESSETCDPPNNTTCTADCQLHVCGNRITEVGETCDPPNNTSCSASCESHTCGNGIIESGENCDPPNAATCSPACQLHSCGNGIVESGETCEPPNGTTCGPSCMRIPVEGCPAVIDQVSSAGAVESDLCLSDYSLNECGEQCSQITPKVCLDCEALVNDGSADCNYVQGVALSGPAAGTSRAALCRQTVECFRKTGCAKLDTVSCYCGTSGSSCFSASSQRNGACAAIMEASFETTDAATVATRFSDVTFGGAVATLRMDTDQQLCRAQCFPAMSGSN